MASVLTRFRLFGLTFESALPLRGFESVDTPADVALRRWSFDGAPPIAGEILTYPDVCRFLTDGRQVFLEPAPSAEVDILEQAILGPVMAIVLRRRGFLALHASAVELAGRAILLIGPSGHGKSTLALSITARGHRFVADDLAAVRIAGETSTIVDGIQRPRLLPHSAERLGLTAPPNWVHHQRDRRVKRRLGPPQPPADRTTPVARVYVLALGEVNHVEDMGHFEAFAALFANTHEYHHVNTSEHDARTHLEQSTTLIEQVGVRRLVRRWDLDDLETVAQLVEDDVLAG